jgi:hypothetical protein
MMAKVVEAEVTQEAMPVAPPLFDNFVERHTRQQRIQRAVSCVKRFAKRVLVLPNAGKLRR